MATQEFWQDEQVEAEWQEEPAPSLRERLLAAAPFAIGIAVMVAVMLGVLNIVTKGAIVGLVSARSSRAEMTFPPPSALDMKAEPAKRIPTTDMPRSQKKSETTTAKAAPPAAAKAEPAPLATAKPEPLPRPAPKEIRNQSQAPKTESPRPSTPKVEAVPRPGGRVDVAPAPATESKQVAAAPVEPSPVVLAKTAPPVSAAAPVITKVDPPTALVAKVDVPMVTASIAPSVRPEEKAQAIAAAPASAEPPAPLTMKTESPSVATLVEPTPVVKTAEPPPAMTNTVVALSADKPVEALVSPPLGEDWGGISMDIPTKKIESPVVAARIAAAGLTTPAPATTPDKPVQVAALSPNAIDATRTMFPAIVPIPVPRPPSTPAQLLGLEGKALARAENCLARAIYFESRGEPVRGQMAVAQVVVNRAFTGYYPEDICNVVYQNAHRKLACQFTFACDGLKHTLKERANWARARRIATQTLAGKMWVPQIGKATHYHAYWVNPKWVRDMRRLYRVGVHTFYRPRNWGDGSDEPAWGPPAPAPVPRGRPTGPIAAR